MMFENIGCVEVPACDARLFHLQLRMYIIVSTASAQEMLLEGRIKRRVEPFLGLIFLKIASRFIVISRIL